MRWFVSESRSLGRPFGWLWAAYAVSSFGTWLAFDAFPLIAIHDQRDVLEKAGQVLELSGIKRGFRAIVDDDHFVIVGIYMALIASRK